MNTTRRSFLTVGSALALTALSGTFSRAAVQPVKKDKMKLSFQPYELKLVHPFTVATYTRTATPDVQAEIHYGGFTGYGEASMPQYLGATLESVQNFLGQVDLSRFSDPFEIEAILDYVDGIAEGNTAAKAAVDIALHDLTGKLLGAPRYKIWGLSLDKIPPTTFTIGIDKADVVREKTKEAGSKFKILKVKLGRDNDKEMIETIRSVSDVPIAVDVNQGWTDKQYALDMICWLKEKGIVMVEQPLPKTQLEDTGWLTERSPLPIFADEAVQRLKDIMQLKDYFSGINIKLMKCTGMREAWKIANLVRSCGKKVMLGCMTETSCAIAAAVHLSPLVDFVDLDGNILISNDRFTGVTLKDGRQLPSDKPGLGITLKPAA
ncbi:MAG: dipeptide epimerase [Planctomycetaceae bacterium]|nr:dipeptide epimerase [Planctomycetaceae bacterium]